MEAEVDEPLRDVIHGNAAGFLISSRVDDALMRHAARAFYTRQEVRIEPAAM